MPQRLAFVHVERSEVLICACDTFRAGAVEQLKTHSRRSSGMQILIDLYI